MLDHPVHKIPVVRYHYQASGEVEQKILEHRQRWQIQVVRGFVEDQEIRIPEQDGQQMQSFFFSPAEARDISVLFIRRKEKEVQELGCAKRAAACQWKTFCNIFHKFDNAFIFFDHEARLRIVSEYHGLPDIDLSAVGRFQPLQHIQES